MLKSIVIEIRPKLQSVNVFMRVNSSSSDYSVKLNAQSFDLIFNDTETVNINCKNIKIVTDSLSSFKISEGCVTFRFRTNNSSYGGFKSELLQNYHRSSPLDTKTLSENFVVRGKTYLMQCINCKNNLCDQVFFNRVLPLPSDCSEPNEWFCHSHTDFNLSLTPKVSDIFYSHCYIHINNSIIKSIKMNKNILFCQRCLCWLGLIKNPDTYKFWLNTVQFVNENNSFYTNSLSDVFVTIRDVLKQNPLSSAKLLLNCESAPDQIDYLLIWMVEKKLNVLLDTNFCGDLKEVDVAKILFKFESSCKSDTVKQWENDVNVNSVTISKPMILALLKHLYHFNKLFSNEFSESNGFHISYLLIYNS